MQFILNIICTLNGFGITSTMQTFQKLTIYVNSIIYVDADGTNFVEIVFHTENNSKRLSLR